MSANRQRLAAKSYNPRSQHRQRIRNPFAVWTITALSGRSGFQAAVIRRIAVSLSSDCPRWGSTTGYGQSRMKWRLVVAGEDRNLRTLSRLFEGCDPGIASSGADVFFEASQLDDQDDCVAAVRTATPILRMMNGVAAAMAPMYSPVVLTGQVEDDRGGRHSVISPDAVHARITVPGGISADIQDLVAAAVSDSDVGAVFNALGDGTFDQSRAWKAYELIRRSLGGQKALVATGCTSEGAVKAFRAWANEPGVSGDAARHAHPSEMPDQIIDDREAHRWLSQLIKCWVDTKSGKPD